MKRIIRTHKEEQTVVSVKDYKKKAKQKGLIEITATVICDGSNVQKVMLMPKIDFTTRIAGSEYHIEQGKMFNTEAHALNFLEKIRRKWKHITDKYQIFFIEDNPDAILIEPNKGLITPATLEIIERNTSLRSAISSLFQTHIGGRKIIFFVIIAIVGVVVYFAITGQVDINKLMGGKK